MNSTLSNVLTSQDKKSTIGKQSILSFSCRKQLRYPVLHPKKASQKTKSISKTKETEPNITVFSRGNISKMQSSMSTKRMPGMGGGFAHSGYKQ
jgi:hypothetical protein